MCCIINIQLFLLYYSKYILYLKETNDSFFTDWRCHFRWPNTTEEMTNNKTVVYNKKRYILNFTLFNDFEPKCSDNEKKLTQQNC
jgi:hypothetical protein